MIREHGWEIGNIDATVCLEKPKLKDHITAMQTCLADVLNIEKGQVSVKATTTETMGFVGTGEGVAVYAVAMLFRPGTS
jgi:2-C-methyl-D-erythritol 2,4-cyclodiphosphate synthase